MLKFYIIFTGILLILSISSFAQKSEVTFGFGVPTKAKKTGFDNRNYFELNYQRIDRKMIILGAGISSMKTNIKQPESVYSYDKDQLFPYALAAYRIKLVSIIDIVPNIKLGCSINKNTWKNFGNQQSTNIGFALGLGLNLSLNINRFLKIFSGYESIASFYDVTLPDTGKRYNVFVDEHPLRDGILKFGVGMRF
ncbi:MAG: hypothetical protein ACEPOV_03985 [Hyphomicrobiales bacterium]